MIAIVDYGVGNLFSLRCSLENIGADCIVTADKQKITDADKIILPGVGAFGKAAEALRTTGLDELLRREAQKGKPLLGICLGMQLLFERSCEYGDHQGLGLIPGSIEGLGEALAGEALKIPHMGWNDLTFARQHPILRHNRQGDFVYYVHSFYAPVSHYTVAWSQYGSAQVTGIAAKDNVAGTQFHPEKSGDVGLAMLKAFTEM